MSRVLWLIAVLLLASCGDDVVRSPASSPALPTSPTPPSPPSPSPSVNEQFELTVAADPVACSSLPAETLVRHYVGRFTGSSVGYLYGARFLGGAVYANWNVVYRNTTSGTLWFQDPPLWESLAGDSYLVIYGSGPSQVRPGESTPFWGRFEYCADREPDPYPKCATTLITCTSSVHQFAMQPQ